MKGHGAVSFLFGIPLGADSLAFDRMFFDLYSIPSMKWICFQERRLLLMANDRIVMLQLFLMEPSSVVLPLPSLLSLSRKCLKEVRGDETTCHFGFLQKPEKSSATLFWF